MSPFRITATKISNHLACRHLTTLDLLLKRKQIPEPTWAAPNLDIIRQLGEQHEKNYLQFLRDLGRNVILIDPDKTREDRDVEETLQHMRAGADVIAQAALKLPGWFGRADVLLKVDAPPDKPSKFGDWSYEAVDCKLTRETRGETLLQLCVYSELLEQIQGVRPESMHVIPGGANFKSEDYRVDDFFAYYSHVKDKFLPIWTADPAAASSNEAKSPNGEASSNGASSPNGTYPEPCSHCEICRWFQVCDKRRRADDHLSLVAGISRLQRDQLLLWHIDHVTQLAAMPDQLPSKPKRGSRDGYLRVRDQANLQVKSRGQLFPIFEPLTLVPEMGFYRLPTSSPHDVFIDFEGDPYAHSGEGHQYLFGILAPDQNGILEYQGRWALTPEEEKEAFEWYVELIMSHWQQDRAMHIYHFGAYEPTQFKRLMSRYMTREKEVDRMLRGRFFTDLHSIFKQAIRAGVEQYSLKQLEIIYGFNRQVPIDKSREAMRYFEHGLELGRELNPNSKTYVELKNAMEGYNHEDCRSTAQLRTWLESQRAEAEKSAPEAISRPEILSGDPPEKVEERQRRVDQLLGELTAPIPPDPKLRSTEQSATWLLAHLLDLHHRELKVSVWESYRLAELSDDEAIDDPKAIGGLEFLQRVNIENKCPIDRYAFPTQDLELRKGKKLQLNKKGFGEIVAIDKASRTIDIKKTKKMVGIHPPTLHLGERVFNIDEQQKSLLRLGDWVREHGIDSAGPYRAARDLLLRKSPRLLNGLTLPLAEQDPIKAAQQSLPNLDHSFLAIQGPPGSGKTYNGAHLICDLVRSGKKVGITALGHKVISNLFKDVVLAADNDPRIRCMQVLPKDKEIPFGVIRAETDQALDALRSGAANIVGGTSWLWSPEKAAAVVDYLFIDEAGQMALGDVLAAAQAAKNLVLIGDPQQLERPLKASHPEGADISALEHILGEHKTIPPELGLFLPYTHRLRPEICEFTSSVFYDGKLESNQVARNTNLEGHPWLKPGLWYVPIRHEGNRSASPEEVGHIAAIVDSLLEPGIQWFRSIGNPERLKENEIMIIAPYNLQVFDLSQRMPNSPVGTVDKFQGQQAPVVIYSLTSSSPQDVPHGMEFLYSPNRFNVATSRAKTCAIVVGSPALFEPECHTPKQMRLANAFCRFLQLATTHKM